MWQVRKANRSVIRPVFDGISDGIFSDAGLSGIFRLIHVDVAPYSPTLHGVEPSGHARSVTSESTECDSDRISKIRARLTVRNKQGYKTIRGFNRLAPTVRPTSGPPKSGSQVPTLPRCPYAAPSCASSTYDACAKRASCTCVSAVVC